MVTNESGQVALKRFQTINRLVSVDGTEYVFHTQNNICLAWIQPEHVGRVLAVQRVCCGGSKKPMFTYASEVDVKRWQYGGR